MNDEPEEWPYSDFGKSGKSRVDIVALVGFALVEFPLTSCAPERFARVRFAPSSIL